MRLFPFAFFFMFVLFPLIELALLITIGGKIGIWWTLVIVIGTAFLGTTLLRLQGFGVFQRAMSALDEGRMPVEPVMEGLFLLVAGALLITPGLISDAIGIGLLVPPIRIAVAKFVLARMISGGKVSWSVRRTGEQNPSDRRDPRNGGKNDSGIIEGDYERVDDDPRDPTER